VWDFYQDIYPSDPAKREALNLCMLRDVGFNRLDRAARDQCYQHAFAAPTLAAASDRMDRAPNQVDFRQAAGWGAAPRNDLRVIQQTSGQMR
jgi:hypothetical protein